MIKLDQLRRLDESSTKKGLACSLTMGTISSLIPGIGMCYTTLWGEVLFVPGILSSVRFFRSRFGGSYFFLNRNPREEHSLRSARMMFSRLI